MLKKFLILISIIVIITILLFIYCSLVLASRADEENEKKQTR